MIRHHTKIQTINMCPKFSDHFILKYIYLRTICPEVKNDYFLSISILVFISLKSEYKLLRLFE